MVHHRSSYGNFLHNLRIACLPCQKVGCAVYQRGDHYDCFCIYSAVLAESILEQLSYVITQILKPLSQSVPVQNKIILGDTLGTSATGLFVFISAILSAVLISLIRYKRILIPSLLSMVLLVPLLHSCKHSSVARLSFYCNCKSYCLVHFKRHANSDRHRAV